MYLFAVFPDERKDKIQVVLPTPDMTVSALMSCGLCKCHTEFIKITEQNNTGFSLSLS